MAPKEKAVPKTSAWTPPWLAAASPSAKAPSVKASVLAWVEKQKRLRAESEEAARLQAEEAEAARLKAAPKTPPKQPFPLKPVPKAAAPKKKLQLTAKAPAAKRQRLGAFQAVVAEEKEAARKQAEADRVKKEEEAAEKIAARKNLQKSVDALRSSRAAREAAEMRCAELRERIIDDYLAEQ